MNGHDDSFVTGPKPLKDAPFDDITVGVGQLYPAPPLPVWSTLPHRVSVDLSDKGGDSAVNVTVEGDDGDWVKQTAQEVVQYLQDRRVGPAGDQ